MRETGGSLRLGSVISNSDPTTTTHHIPHPPQSFFHFGKVFFTPPKPPDPRPPPKGGRGFCSFRVFTFGFETFTATVANTNVTVTHANVTFTFTLNVTFTMQPPCQVFWRGLGSFSGFHALTDRCVCECSTPVILGGCDKRGRTVGPTPFQSLLNTSNTFETITPFM